MTISAWHLLKLGQTSHSKSMTMKGAPRCKTAFPALVGLIIHDNFGPILFDTGYDEAFFAATQSFPESLYRAVLPVEFSQTDSMEFQLRKYGLSPSEIKGVFLSHFHGDHLSGINNFPNAKIFCAKLGLAQISENGRINNLRQGLLKSLLPKDIEKRATFFEDMKSAPLSNEFAPFENGIDVLGDKSLFAIELKGHCVGHWGLVICPKNQKPVFFVGDAAWSIEAIEKNIPPPAITTALLGQTKPYRQTLAQLNALHMAAKDRLEIIPSHCERIAKKWISNE